MNVKKTGTSVQVVQYKNWSLSHVYVPTQPTWTPCCHLSWSCWTTSPVRVMVCRSEKSGCCSCCCCWLLPLWTSVWVRGWTMDMWTFRLWAFSKRFPHSRQANSKSASALCLVMWYLSDARWRHWKPQTSHLKGRNTLASTACLRTKTSVAFQG